MTRSTVGIAAAIAVIACSAAFASDTPASSSDLRVVRDPETGELRAPTPKELAALTAIEKTSKRIGPATVGVRKMRDRTKVATLPMSYMTSVTVVRAADGSLTYAHDDPALDASSPQREEQ
ncbi:MAG: post-PEP-CTERM-1 domain-containing protein [Steroidobacteraceae bacterium]